MNNKLKIIFCSVFAGLLLWLCIGVTLVAAKIDTQNEETNDLVYVDATTIRVNSDSIRMSYLDKTNQTFYSNIKVEYTQQDNWEQITEEEYDATKSDDIKTTYLSTVLNSSDTYWSRYLYKGYVLLKQYDNFTSSYKYYKVGYQILETNKLKFVINNNNFTFFDTDEDTYSITLPETNIYKEYYKYNTNNRLTEIRTSEFNITITY